MCSRCEESPSVCFINQPVTACPLLARASSPSFIYQTLPATNRGGLTERDHILLQRYSSALLFNIFSLSVMLPFWESLSNEPVSEPHVLTKPESANLAYPEIGWWKNQYWGG